MGKKTGIEVGREVPGLIPTEAWKKRRFNTEWSPGETLYVAIGQSFVLTTTIQLANAYASLVNGGTLYKPMIVKTVQNEDSKTLKENIPQVLDRTNLKKETVDLVTEGLWGVVNAPGGTANWMHKPGMEFAGKTGTVQVFTQKAEKIYQKCENLRFRQRHHGVFVGYAPIKNPSIVVAVYAEHACSGSQGAAPIAKEVIETYLRKYYPDVYNDKALAEARKKPGATFKPTAGD